MDLHGVLWSSEKTEYYREYNNNNNNNAEKYKQIMKIRKVNIFWNQQQQNDRPIPNNKRTS
jgi:hypothetical protein